MNSSLYCRKCRPTELFIAQWYQKKGASIVYEMPVKQIFDSFFFSPLNLISKEAKEEGRKKKRRAIISVASHRAKGKGEKGMEGAS